MKRVFVGCIGLLLSVISLCAQQVDSLLNRVSHSLDSLQIDKAVQLFRSALSADVEKSEIFYWTEVNKKNAGALRLAHELAIFYQKKRNYDKSCLFYRELLCQHPNDIDLMTSCAEMELMRGREDEARVLYEWIVEANPGHLQANIFLGNYYYLHAEHQRQKLVEQYRKIATPTRMQYARYRESLSALYHNEYTKAKSCLQRVMMVFASTEAARTLEKIHKIEREVDK